MAAFYIVEQGDHIGKLALRFGLNYRAIWEHPNNAQLKALRQNPSVLLPGDRLFIPDRSVREETLGIDQRHRFKTSRAPLRLRITLEDIFFEPIAHANCALNLGARTIRLQTNAEGKIDEAIDPDVHEVILVVHDKERALSGLPITIKVGDLDPVQEKSGQIARLNAMGYSAGKPINGDDAQFRSAVEEFQCDFGLQVDGKCGPTTQGKLKKVYGC